VKKNDSPMGGEKEKSTIVPAERGWDGAFLSTFGTRLGRKSNKHRPANALGDVNWAGRKRQKRQGKASGWETVNAGERGTGKKKKPEKIRTE